MCVRESAHVPCELAVYLPDPPSPPGIHHMSGVFQDRRVARQWILRWIPLLVEGYAPVITGWYWWVTPAYSVFPPCSVTGSLHIKSAGH